MWPMSARLDKVDDNVSTLLGRSRRSSGRWWSRRQARQELAARETAELTNEFGDDAYWLACICVRRSRGALRRHWLAVVGEIERGMGKAAAAPRATRKTAGGSPAASDQYFAPLSAPKHDGSRRDDHRRSGHDAYDGDRQPRGGYHRASQIADMEELERLYEAQARYAREARHERSREDNFDHHEATRPHVAQMHDRSPRKNRRRVIALALIGWATIGTAGTYLYRASYSGTASTRTSAAPAAAKPAQPGVPGSPSTANAAAGGYVVQVTAQRSKADAQASFRSLQAKFPRQLGSRSATVKRSDLGAKGVFYRALVGPFASAGEANELCGSLKTAGGQCIVQRN
jgi:hypothetical protein